MSRLVFFEERELEAKAYDDSDDHYGSFEREPKQQQQSRSSQETGSRRRRGEEPVSAPSPKRKRRRRERGSAETLVQDTAGSIASRGSSSPVDLTNQSEEPAVIDVTDESGEAAVEARTAKEPRRALVPSFWLRRFIDRPRDTTEVPQPPAAEPLNDAFVQLFASGFSSDGAASPNDDAEIDDDDDLHLSEQNGATRPEADGEDTEVAGEDDVPEPEAESGGAVALRLQNLPYNASQSDISAHLESLGSRVVSVTVKYDQKKGLPAGSASCEVLREGLDLDAFITALRQSKMGGRPVRAELESSGKRRSRQSGEGLRYFGVDISCKCYLCGEVGHKSQECINPPLPTPCTLCAGLDHESRMSTSLHVLFRNFCRCLPEHHMLSMRDVRPSVTSMPGGPCVSRCDLHGLR